MRARVMMERIASAPTRRGAGSAGVSSLSAIDKRIRLVGAHGSVSLVIDFIAGLFHGVTTLLLYDILKPVNRGLSLLVAFFGLALCAISEVRAPYAAEVTMKSSARAM